MGASEKNNLGWQLEQLQRRLGEWWELQTLQLGDRLPQLPGFSWLDAATVQFIANLIFWLLLTALSIWLTLTIIKFLKPYFYQFVNQRNINSRKIDKPVLKTQSINAWLEEAQSLKERGNYREACFCLYQATLQLLSDRQIIANEISRTDGEYLKLTKYLPEASYYRTILQLHQKLCFSEIPAGLETFERCQQAYQEIAK